jgi:hypothetical protein
MHLPQGQAAFLDGYVIAADHLYVLSYVSVDRGHLQDFERFVDSLKLQHALAHR